MTSRLLSRRTLLRGISGSVIGLPLLEEMLTTNGIAASTNVAPVRAFNVFFGLGIPAPLQEEGYEGVLEPLKTLQDKILLMRQVDQIRCDKSGMNAHFDGASGAFTATAPGGEARAGGASIDQLVRRAVHPEGMPKGMVPTLIGGTFFRRSRMSRYVHSYNVDGTAAARMQERPRDLFERVFGTVSTGSEGTPDERRDRLKRSVLDSVVEQYKYYTGARSPLGTASKARVSEHLDRIREFEQRAWEMRERDPNAPNPPPPSKILHGGQADPGGEGIDITLDDLSNEWRLMSDLFALAVQMDRTRFGSLTFLAAGERIRLSGDYEYDGKIIHTFDDRTHLNASGSKGCSHEYWHQFSENKENEQLRMHAHMKMREVAYFLHRLNDPNDSMDANGKTILENSLLTISTESGDGRHSDVKRELSGVFHAVCGGGGRFKTGEIVDVESEGVDVYNTMLNAMNVKERLGPADREFRHVDAIRA